MLKTARWVERALFILTRVPTFSKVPHVAESKSVAAKECLKLVIFVLDLVVVPPPVVFETHWYSNEVFDSRLDLESALVRRV